MCIKYHLIIYLIFPGCPVVDKVVTDAGPDYLCPVKAGRGLGVVGGGAGGYQETPSGGEISPTCQLHQYTSTTV